MNLPTLISAALAEPLPRGSRIAELARRARLPSNMRAAMHASESTAWNHSPQAGALWESGFRASRACKLSEKYCCTVSDPVADSPVATQHRPRPIRETSKIRTS